VRAAFVSLLGCRALNSRLVQTFPKAGVAKNTKCAKIAKRYGRASNELFTQFLARIAVELPTATIAMFSTLKYVCAPDLEDFREQWRAKYLGGFVVHNKAFDGLNGNFPIGFLTWRTGPAITSKIGEVEADILNRNAEAIGARKFFNIPTTRFLSKWISRPKANGEDVIPLKNAVTPATATKDLRGTRWSSDAIACMDCAGNDLQHAEQHTVLYSSGYGSAGAFLVTRENVDRAAVVFAVRRLIRPTWLNDRDQFLQPNQTLPNEFLSDCLVWSLFNRNNRTASADHLQWNGRSWSIVNHFIPFTEEEVAAPSRFDSDFMVRHLNGKTLSSEAIAVLDAGRHLWKTYFAHVDSHSVRADLMLNRPDVGWWQVRRALAARNESGDFPPVSFDKLDTSYSELTEKLQPLVFSYGFLQT
jgi:hypothetical protein